MLALGKFLDLTLAGYEPAAKVQVTSDGTRLRWLAEGVLEVTPPQARDSGLDLLLSAGIHGNETAPMELIDRLLRAIAGGVLRPAARMLLVLGNPPAMRRGERFVEQDLNRLFNGAFSLYEGLEALRASDLEHLVSVFFAAGKDRQKLHYDLHTTQRGSQFERFALYPWSEGRVQSRAAIARLARAGIEAVLLQNRSANTFSAYTFSVHQAESFTLELGQARPLGQNQGVNVQALESLLSELIEGRETPETEPNLPALFAVSNEVLKLSDEFVLNLPDNVENFSELPVGYLLARDVGDKHEVINQPGARVIFPNPRVARGQRAAIVVVPDEGLCLA